MKEFPLSAIADFFQFRCQRKQLMLLSYKISPCFVALLLKFIIKLRFPTKVSITTRKFVIVPAASDTDILVCIINDVKYVAFQYCFFAIILAITIVKECCDWEH